MYSSAKCWIIFEAAVLWVMMATIAMANDGWLTTLNAKLPPLTSEGSTSVEREWQHVVVKVQSLPENLQVGAVAATVSAEGHWTFSNADGEVFIVANNYEMSAMIDALFPDGVDGHGLTIYLTPVAAFLHQEQLKKLPVKARLRLTLADKSYRLQIAKVGTAKDHRLYALVRRDVALKLTNRALFEELVWQLEQPFMRRKVRILSVVANGPAALPRWLPSRHKSGALFIERIAPQHLIAALPALSQQLVVLTGRIKGDDFIIRASDGEEIKFELDKIRLSAAAYDVGLIFLNSKAPRQPGVRNWLFQKVDVDGLGEALQRKTLADFIGSLALAANKVEVRGEVLASDRVQLSIVPLPSSFVISTDGVVGFIAELASEVAGTVLPYTVQLDLPARVRVEELSWRLIPGIPAVLQVGFAVLFVLGLFSIKTAWHWWSMVWPPEIRQDYGVWFGYQAARFVRFLIFVLVFLPIAGVPALIWFMLTGGYWLIMLPFAGR